MKTVFQGHYHPGLSSRYGDVAYVTLPAVCENENAFFVFDTRAPYELAACGHGAALQAPEDGPSADA